MDKISSDEIKDLMNKYTDKLQGELGTEMELTKPGVANMESLEYNQFKDEYLPKHMSWYEKACKFAESLVSVKPDPKKEAEIKESIEICHLNVTPAGVTSFALIGPFAIMLIGLLISVVIPILLGNEAQLFFAFFFVVTGMVLIFPLNKYPHFLANNWRLKASNEMVLSIFYVVTYMRHTSNLENAIAFAAEHLNPPLSLDLAKVLWNVENEKFENIKESLENYLATWKKWNMEYIEAFHMIESSLFESAEERRIGLLEKSLEVILEETYEKMLHYAHNLQSPVMMLNMLGVVLPIMGLVILPLVVAFMEGVKWYHISMGYNVVLPIGLYYLTKTILASRPTGYGDNEAPPGAGGKDKKVSTSFLGIKIKATPVFLSTIFIVGFCLLGFSPLLINMLNCNFDFGLPGGVEISNTAECDGVSGKAAYYLLEYREDLKTGDVQGPFGLGATLLSLAWPLGLGVGLGIFYRLTTSNVIEVRRKAKELEAEFASALFQLGNRLGDGIPAEIAFSRVSEIMEGTISGNFFRTVSMNITKMGMSVQDAIFNPRVGAIVYFPSSLIESSMKVLVESSKKGPVIASQALLNVAIYIKQIHKVDERLKDLMADIIASLKSQISFLSPTISGVVIGITSMITSILGKLTSQMSKLSSDGGGGMGGMASGMSDMFKAGVPTYYFQVIVGLYVVQLVFILTQLVNGIENGADTLGEKYMIGRNLVKSTFLYCTISFIVILLFNLIAGTILASTL